MSEPLRPLSIAPQPSATDDRLDSWKEIAAHLGREVRTVQGWEKNEGLPIHRHQHARQGSVYAFKSELDSWRASRRNLADAQAPSGESPTPTRRPAWVIAAAICAVAAVIAGAFLWKNRRVSGDTPSSVVVLPFLDLSPQHDQDYFSDGLTEEIIDALSRVPNLRVVARTSAFAFKGKAADVREIGKQLDVSAVLEGSVRKDGNRLLVTAQLNRVSDGTHLWSRKYDRELRDVFAVQQEISQAIASQLRAGAIPQRSGTADLEAYQRYQEGRYFFNRQEPASYYKAIERYNQAIARDPKFALAYAGLADAYAYLSENFAVAPREVMPRAKEAAEKAVALDDNLAEGHISLGLVKIDYEWDREGGQREFRRAMDLNPGSGWARHWYAHSLEAQGKLDDAMREMRAAFALDPLSLVIYWDIANELTAAGRPDDALRHLAKADELYPGFWILSWEKAEAYFQKGDLESMHRVIEAMQTSNPEMKDEPPFIAEVGVAAAREGRRAEARQVLDRLENLRKTRYVEPYMAMELASALRDRDRTRLWFDRMVEERSSLCVYLPLELKAYFNNHPDVIELAAKLR